jgi:uncharacterized protein YjbI with pentapeptide repeats
MKTVNPPLMPKDLRYELLAEVKGGSSVGQIHCEKLVFTGLEAKNISLDTVIIENSEISSCKFRKSNLSDVIFDNCLLFGTDFDGSGWRRVAIKSGMYSGVVLSDVSLEDVAFKDAKLNLANFRVAKLRSVEFSHCDLTEADFQGADMSSVAFKDCNLSGVNFGNCKLRDVDLRTSNLSTVQGIAGLKGATIDLNQLIVMSQTMAAELGIKVVQ